MSNDNNNEIYCPVCKSDSNSLVHKETVHYSREIVRYNKYNTDTTYWEEDSDLTEDNESYEGNESEYYCENCHNRFEEEDIINNLEDFDPKFAEQFNSKEEKN